MTTPLEPRLRIPAYNRYVADCALAVGVAGLTVLFDFHGPDMRSTAALGWDVALAVPLVVRRRSPMAATAVIAALCLVQWSLDVRAIGDVAFLIALYTVGAHPRPPWLLPAAVVTAEIGVVLVVLRWANHSGFITGVLLTGTVTAAWLLGVYVRTRRAYLTSVIDRAETAERDRDSRAQVAVAAERARIAREMHDVIAHSLSIMITLNDAAGAVAADPQVRDTVRRAAEVGRQALGEMQLMLGVLHTEAAPELIPQPGAEQLSDLVATARSAGLSVHLTTTGDLAGLPATAQLAVYRIVQESLTNIVKHGRNVSRVTVTITQQPHQLAITVANDGDLVPTKPPATSGHGLAGMRERAEIYSGSVHATPNRRGGWTVQATLKPVETTSSR